ncbi:MAG: MurR/RpiR family transcriptional regulator [Actinomycetota bacterium]
MSSNHPPAVRRVVDVLDELGPRVALMSALDIADRAQVSDATVIRTARLLGHAGFDELKRAAIGDDWSSRTAATIADHPVGGASGTAERFHDSARAVAHAAGEALPRLEAAGRAIDGAERVVVGGIGPAAGIAQTTVVLLQRCGIPATATTATGRNLADQLVTTSAEDVLLLFSYADRHPQLPAFRAAAAATGCPLVVIGSPPLADGDTSIGVPVTRGAAAGLASLVPTLAVVEALVVDLMRRRPERTRGAAERLDELRRAARQG